MRFTQETQQKALVIARVLSNDHIGKLLSIDIKTGSKEEIVKKKKVVKEYESLIKHLRSVVMSEEFHCQQGGDYAKAKPLGDLCAYLIKRSLKDMQVYSHEAQKLKKPSLKTASQEELAQVSELIEIMCHQDNMYGFLFNKLVFWRSLPSPEVQTGSSKGLVMHRFFLKNRIAIAHVETALRSFTSASEKTILSFSVYKGHNAVWGYGGDIFRFNTSINKSLQVKFYFDPANHKEVKLDVQNKSNISDIMELIKSNITGGVADLPKLKKALLFAREGRIHVSGDEEIMISLLPDDVQHVHLLSFASNQDYKPLNPEADYRGLVVVGVFARDVWCPFISTSDATLKDLLEHFLNVFIGSDKSKTGFGPSELLKCMLLALKINFKEEQTRKFTKELEAKPLTTKLTAIIADLQKLDKFESQPFDIRVGGSSPGSVREVDLIVNFDWSQIKPENKFLTEGQTDLIKQVNAPFIFGNSKQPKVAAVESKDPKKPEDPNDPKKATALATGILPLPTEFDGRFKARIQKIRVLELKPKISDVLSDLWDIDKQIDPIKLQNPLDDVMIEVNEMTEQIRKLAPPTEAESIQKSRSGIRPGFGFFFPAIYCVNVGNISSSVDCYSDLEFKQYLYLEKEEEDYVSVRYRPIGMIFKQDQEDDIHIYNALEICVEELQVIKEMPKQLIGDLFEKEYRKMTPNAPAKFEAKDIQLSEIQKSRLVTYYKYHGSTYDKAKKTGKRQPVKYLLKEELALENKGYIHTIIYEKKPVE